MGQGADRGLTMSLIRPSADASFSRKNMKILKINLYFGLFTCSDQRTPKIKLSGDILVLSSDDVVLVMESSLHFNPIKLQSSTGSN